MPQEINSEQRKFVGPVDRANLETEIATAIGETMSDINLVADSIAFSWDPEKKMIIAEKYSELGNVIEFYEVRVIVGYIGDGRYDG